MHLRRLESNEVDLHREIRLRALQGAPDSFGESYADVAALPVSYRQNLTRSVTERSVTEPGRVGGMWVEPAWRRHGVGGALLQEVFRWAGERGLSRLGDLPDFAEALLEFDGRRSTADLIRDLAAAFAHEFLEQVDTPVMAIVFTHAITGVAASERIGRCVDDVSGRALLAHAWQTGCALHAAYSGEPRADDSSCELTPVESIDAAVARGDDHVIKLTEACLDFHRRYGDTIFLAVPARASQPKPRRGDEYAVACQR